MRGRIGAGFVGLVLAVTGPAGLTACGDEVAGGVARVSPEADERARRVAEAWDGSAAARAWRAGYHPMGEVEQPPAGGWRSAADRRAFDLAHFELRGALSAKVPPAGEVRWRDGRTLAPAAHSARAAYDALDRTDGDGIPHLTVTGATLGTMTVVTSRGPATVPAWLFTLDGYDAPLARAAVAPSPLAKPPIGRARGQDAGGIDELQGLKEVGDGGRSVTVGAHHGACDDGPVVHVRETGGSVVLSASVTGPADALCTAEMLAQDVTVRLERPLADRVLLDALTGRPVPFDGRGPHASWSE
ncbi:hypothetical protein [Streptomyces sp. NPDC060194]|uniref:hypothetical protein n=1 Tax=Streptomyces sp. NPDC060194 TaxID=3347069 RepID=UPI00365841BF